MTSEQQRQCLSRQIDRLKQELATRVGQNRPIPHSVAVAYRQMIATFEQAANGSGQRTRDDR
jgi:hypothetical protein